MKNLNLSSISVLDKLPPPKLPNDRWHKLEIIFWLLPFVVFFAFQGYLVLASQVMILGLFALSLDLILGYAGILSLGHRSEEHTSELQSRENLVCRLLLEKKN